MRWQEGAALHQLHPISHLAGPPGLRVSPVPPSSFQLRPTCQDAAQCKPVTGAPAENNEVDRLQAARNADCICLFLIFFCCGESASSPCCSKFSSSEVAEKQNESGAGTHTRLCYWPHPRDPHTQNGWHQHPASSVLAAAHKAQPKGPAQLRTKRHLSTGG